MSLPLSIEREDRYIGLLDKLLIEDATGALPSGKELWGAISWLVEMASKEALTTLPSIVKLEELNHLVVLVTDAMGPGAGVPAAGAWAGAGVSTAGTALEAYELPEEVAVTSVSTCAEGVFVEHAVVEGHQGGRHGRRTKGRLTPRHHREKRWRTCCET